MIYDRPDDVEARTIREAVEQAGREAGLVPPAGPSEPSPSVPIGERIAQGVAALVLLFAVAARAIAVYRRSQEIRRPPL
jgi:hypothetical protein